MTDPDRGAALGRLQRERDALKAELQGGHQRLNECLGWEKTKDLPLYDRISQKIQQLADAKAEVEHLLKATGLEKEVYHAKAEAAEHRRAAAEYRASRIGLDKELQAENEKLTADVARLRHLAHQLAGYARHLPDCEISKGKTVVYPEPITVREGYAHDHRRADSWPNLETANLQRTSSRLSECTCGLAALTEPPA